MNGTLQVYDRMADEYVELVAKSPSAELAQFIKDITPPARILDLGCGPGHHAARIAEAGFEVLAVDGSAEMVKRASRHDGVNAVHATFDDIPEFGPVGGIWQVFRCCTPLAPICPGIWKHFIPSVKPVVPCLLA